jgi:hypothetical protein
LLLVLAVGIGHTEHHGSAVEATGKGCVKYKFKIDAAMRRAMGKKYLTLIVCLIAIPVIAAVTFCISLFYVGGARGGDILYIDRVAVTKDLIQLDGGTASSGEAYKNYEYTIKGEDLYITINYVLVSKAYQSGNFSIKIEDDLNQVKRIYLDAGENKKLIWQNNPAELSVTKCYSDIVD